MYLTNRSKSEQHLMYMHVALNCSGTGALAIFLKKMFAVDITTSDFDDMDIENNIAHNCAANGLQILPHIRRMHFNCFDSYIFMPLFDILYFMNQDTT